MKTDTFRKIALVLMLFLSMSMAAQKEYNDSKQRMPREKMDEAQAKNIATELKLEGATYNKFVETYANYRKELWATMPKHNRKKQRPENETEEMAAERMKENFERSQKMLDLRTEYYHKFSKFLSQKQIEQMYKKEKKMAERLKQRMKNGKPHGSDKPKEPRKD